MLKQNFIKLIKDVWCIQEIEKHCFIAEEIWYSSVLLIRRGNRDNLGIISNIVS